MEKALSWIYRTTCTTLILPSSIIRPFVTPHHAIPKWRGGIEDGLAFFLSLSDHAIVIISKHYAHERIERQAHWMNILPLKKKTWRGKKLAWWDGLVISMIPYRKQVRVLRMFTEGYWNHYNKILSKVFLYYY